MNTYFSVAFKLSFLFVLSLLLFSCGDDGKEGVTPTPSLDPPRVYFVQPNADTEVFVGESITFELRTRGVVDSYELLFEGTKVAEGQGFEDFTYAHTFDTEGSFTLTFSATNEAGTVTETLTVTVLPPPPTKTELLTGGSSKRWKFISLTRNQEQDITDDDERDDVLELYATPFTKLGQEYNYKMYSDPSNEQFYQYGNWSLVIEDVYIKLNPLHDDNARIVELTENRLVYSIRITENTTLFYTYEAE